MQMANASFIERRKKYSKRYDELKTERDSSWLPHWRELAENIRPRAFREFQTDSQQGGKKKHQKVINSTPLDSARVLASGMMSGITSPARPWFRFTLKDPRQNLVRGAKAWLARCEELVREAIAKSNIYKGLHGTYSDLGPFGTGAFWVDEDAEDGLRAYVLPIGSYVLANSSRMAIDTCYRELTLTTGQLVEMFGIERCSRTVQEQHRAERCDEKHEVLHLVEPNRDYAEGRLGAKGMKFISIWFERRNDATQFLREAGYYEFPVMAPRWETTGEDVYGSSPGMTALGDCKALQHLERRSALATDKVVNPPMQLPTQLQQGPVSLLPGDRVFVDGLSPQQVVRPAMEVNPAAIDIFERKIQRHEQRIRRAFYADLWLALTESDGKMTAREVIERRDEKLLQLGTVLENLQDELLDPLLSRVFMVLWRSGQIPEPPPEIQGTDFKIEYISIMASAQKLLATTGLERLMAFVGGAAATNPEALDNIDVDKIVAAYADALGVPPDTIREKDAVAALRRARAQAQQQAHDQEQAAMAADTAHKLGKTPLDPNNTTALTEMLRGQGQR